MSAHPSLEELEVYAAGLADESERAAIGEHVAGCAECRPALESAEDLAWELALATERAAPASLRQRVVRARRPRGFAIGWPRLALAASGALVLALAVALAQANAELARVRTENEVPARALAAISAGAQVIELRRPGGGAPGGRLVVAANDDAYLLLDLPAPPPGKTYEAWVISGGKAARAGLAPARGGVVAVRLEAAIRPGDVAAVTLESAGGADQPTSAPLLVATRLPPG